MNGYRLTVSDGSLGAWIIGDSPDSGSLSTAAVRISTSGSGVVRYIPASGNAIVGAVSTGVLASGNTLVCVDASGVIYSTNSTSSVVSVSNPGFNAVAKGLAYGHSIVSTGNAFYTSLPASGVVGLWDTNLGQIYGVPFPTSAVPNVIAVSGSIISIGALSPASIASGSIGMLPNPNNASGQTALIGSSYVSLFSGSDPVWNPESTLSGLSSCTSAAWASNGASILAAVTSGVQVINITSGSLSLGSVISVTGGVALDVSPSGTVALVANATAKAVVGLKNNTTSWSIGNSVLFSSAPTAVFLANETTAYVTYGASLAIVTYSLGSWSASTTISLGFAGISIIQDSISGAIIVSGGSGVSGGIASVLNGGIASSLTWAGSYGLSAICQNSQIAVLNSSGTSVQMFGVSTSGVLSAQGSVSLTGTKTYLAQTYNTVWAGDTANVSLLKWDKPYTFKKRKTGSISSYIGGSWYTYTLGVQHTPSAISYDASGNVWVATNENDIYSVNISGVLQSYRNTGVYSGQTAGTTLGLSSLLWENGKLFASTQFAGALVEVI